MEIFPRDLGMDRYLTVLRRRLSPVTGASPSRAPSTETSEKKSRRPRRLLRFWTRDLELAPEDTEKVGSLIWNSAPGVSARIGLIIFSIYALGFSIIPAMTGAPGVAFFLFLVWSAVAGAMMLSPRASVRRAHKKALDATEVEGLLPVARGRLEEAYLNLVRDAMRAEVPSASAQEDIRAALRLLGETIARLPAERAPTQDSFEMAKTVRALRDQAAQETDAVVRESLLRQAATLEKRVGTADETARLAKRVQTLRREARVQMESLRAVLVGFDAHSAAANLPGASSLTTANQLAEAVQRAAQEAQSASIARAELEGEELAQLLGRPLPPVQPAPQIQTLRTSNPAPTPAPQPQPTTPPEQQPQNTPGRPWWRNGT